MPKLNDYTYQNYIPNNMIPLKLTTWQSIDSYSKTLATLYRIYRILFLPWWVWADIECMVHVILPKRPINQFKPEESLLSWYLYTAWSETLGLLANSPSSNKGMQIRRWATIKLKQWVLYNRSKILHMAVPKEGISCLYLVKTWVLYINAPATTSHMIWLQLISKWYHQFRSISFTIYTLLELWAWTRLLYNSN